MGAPLPRGTVSAPVALAMACLSLSGALTAHAQGGANNGAAQNGAVQNDIQPGTLASLSPAPLLAAGFSPALSVDPPASPAANAELAPADALASSAALPEAPSAMTRAPLVLPGIGFKVAGLDPGTSLYLSPSADAIAPEHESQTTNAGGAIDLTLSQAVAGAVKNNLQVQLSTLQERGVHGEVFTVGNVLLPNLQAEVYSKAQEINLSALGFKKSLLNTLTIPGFNPATFSTIVKVDTTDAQVSLSQILFNVPAYYLFRSAQRALDASRWSIMDARGAATAGVGGLYLRALADAAQVSDSESLVKQDQVVFDHAKASRDAGVGINLDVLRAQTDLQTEQQRLLQARNAVAKDKIMLNRVMGASAGQQLNLVDTVPFAEMAESTLDEQLETAFQQRQDLLGLEAQLAVAEEAARAVKYERLPTLTAGGFYGVVGVTTTGKYHGDFVAQFKLSMPLFLEGELRGQREVGAAQVIALNQQIAGRKAQIEADIRSSRLDLESSRQLVTVARSNVVLAQQALDDATTRFTSGVDDNLPVVQAQATLVGAQTQVIQAEFQYNYAKLTLARRLGVVETEYARYLGK